MFPADGERTPLIVRPLDDSFGWYTSTSGSSRKISIRRFLRDVKSIAAQLPDFPVAINICRDRYRFTVAFCAAIVRGQANALPPSQNHDVQSRTSKAVGDCYVLHDGAGAAPGLHQFALTDKFWDNNVDSADITELTAQSIPQIPLNQLSAVCFTSGSTGEPTATPKNWRTLQHSTEINAHHYLNGVPRSTSILATVPAQHMYGLEATVLLPLTADVAVHHARPLFPADIVRLLNELPTPKMLVTTPVHLKALINSNVELPPIELCLSATAPLEKELAQSMLSKSGAVVREIYGCSEAGSLATRDIVTETHWRLFDAFQMRQSEQHTFISAEHLLTEVELQDSIEVIQKGRFSLGGRQSDMVNIAGKRNSLSALTGVLAEMPAVQDCVIFNPQPGIDETPRLAALVVSDTLNAQNIQRWLRERLDHAFVPRTIVFVTELPRAATGKLPRAEILKEFDAARKLADDN